LRHCHVFALSLELARPALYVASVTVGFARIAALVVAGACAGSSRPGAAEDDPQRRHADRQHGDGLPAAYAAHGAGTGRPDRPAVVTADPAGAHVLIVQGLADQVMPAAGEAACDVAKLRVEGVEPTICSKIEDVVAWIEAIVTSAPAPTCGSQTLPACNR